MTTSRSCSACTRRTSTRWAEDGASSKLIQSSTTSIVESVDRCPDGEGMRNPIELLKAGKCLNSWTQKNQNLGGHNNEHHCDEDEEMIIVYSLTPLNPIP